MSKNKLRAEKNNSIWIYIGVIGFLLVFGCMLYGTYVYLDYSRTHQVTKFTMDVLTDISKLLASPQSLSVPTGSDIKTIFLYQVTKLWWVYCVLALCVFIGITSQNTNEYRGSEHGSANWADKYSEKKFTDNTGIPIGNNFYASIVNKSGKSYKPNNLNEIVIGGSGAGKSFRKIKPDIMQMYGSYVVTDPKGELYRDTAKMLYNQGYKIRVLNLENITLSHSYNPFKYMADEQNVLNVADLFMKNSAGEGEKEDFWSGAAQDLLVAIMIYLWKSDIEIKSFGRVIRLVNSIQYKDGQINQLCELARCMNQHKIEYPDDAATVNWNSMMGTPQETMGSIAKTLSTRLRLWAVSDVDELTAEDEMDFDHIGLEKTAIFLIIPPARQTYRAVANIFYSQLFERLMYIANNKCNGRLPYLVSCELDEFANIGKIPNFCETLAVVRSHNIRLCIVLQGLSQLKALYEKTYEGIIGNCSLFTYLGTNDIDTKEYVVKRLGKTTVRVNSRSYNRGGSQGGGSDSESYISRDLLTVDELALAMRPRGKTAKLGGSCIAFIDHYRPFFIGKFDTLKHPMIKDVGSSFPKDFHNNTSIEEVYGQLKEERKQKYLEKMRKMKEKEKADSEYAQEIDEQEQIAEHNHLANNFVDNMGDYDFSEVTEEDNIEIESEIENEMETDVNPIAIKLMEEKTNV